MVKYRLQKKKTKEILIFYLNMMVTKLTYIEMFIITLYLCEIFFMKGISNMGIGSMNFRFLLILKAMLSKRMSFIGTIK